MSLNPCQERAKQALVTYVLSKNLADNEIILTGGAGTGKTHTLKEVIEDTTKAYKLLKLTGNEPAIINWIVTATTNKAKEALQSRLPFHNVSTVHSALGLIPKNNKLIPRNQNRLEPSCTNVLIVDECSYINDDLMSHIDGLPEDVKVIYLGDKCQLAPVGCDVSPVFAKSDIEVLELKEQMRMADSPLLQDYCNKLVAFINKESDEFPTIILNDQLQHISADAFKKMTHDVFINQELSTKDHRILSYSNKVVKAHNIRLFKAKNGRADFKRGDTVLNNHYVNGISTDAAVTILDVHKNSEDTATKYIVQSSSSGRVVHVCVPKNVSKFTAALDKHDSKDKAVLDSIADLRPMYACTVHKSQGSTFDTVYLDLSSFRHVKDNHALARLLYVAISRAKTKVVMTGDIT